jgi:ATP-binding cassette subfamily F protein uup
MPLVTLDRASIAYGHLPLLDAVSAQIDEGERVAIVGRNGTGKSTLLRLLGGELAADTGTVWHRPGLRTGMLEQDVPLSDPRSVFDVVSDGLGDLAALVRAYHRTAVDLEAGPSPVLLDRLGALQHELEERDGWRLEQRVELVLARLALPPDERVDRLSGGWRRRVLLARALVAQPDLLLLDEPTNHLDLDTITWLEAFLEDYPGTIVFVTHDRALVERLATRILEIDRGRLRSWPGDYATFLDRKEAWLATEAVQQAAFDRRLAEEEAWLRQGIKARRTRNEGRVRALEAMRQERASRRERPGAVDLRLEAGAPSGRLVFEADGVTKSFGGPPVVRDLTVRIMRGDRVGLIGPNGAGKTTLLRLLLGELRPDAGEVRVGSNVEVAYYDQQRETLDPERTVAETVGDGSDVVTVNGRTRHVMGYLRDFLFPPERARSPVKALSGGERNRLLVARLLTRAANVLVLDEPTNDLDLETLELLESELVAWPGTLLLVSHDRRFLDHVVTSTLVFEGDGRVREYVGGYEDWLRQRAAAAAPPPTPDPPAGRESRASAAAEAPARKRLSYMEQRELDALPDAIDALERERRELQESAAHSEFYKEAPERIAHVLARIDELDGALSRSYARWDELDSRRS